MSAPLLPLEDPAYLPVNPPTPGGGIPAVVGLWGPRSQLRWFRRFHARLRPQPASYWARFYCESLDHIGQCCPSCIDDAGTEWAWEDGCCCRSYRDHPIRMITVTAVTQSEGTTP